MVYGWVFSFGSNQKNGKYGYRIRSVGETCGNVGEILEAFSKWGGNLDIMFGLLYNSLNIVDYFVQNL
jgi:hypothetical protein